MWYNSTTFKAVFENWFLHLIHLKIYIYNYPNNLQIYNFFVTKFYILQENFLKILHLQWPFLSTILQHCFCHFLHSTLVFGPNLQYTLTSFIDSLYFEHFEMAHKNNKKNKLSWQRPTPVATITPKPIAVNNLVTGV